VPAGAIEKQDNLNVSETDIRLRNEVCLLLLAYCTTCSLSRPSSCRSLRWVAGFLCVF